MLHEIVIKAAQGLQENDTFPNPRAHARALIAHALNLSPDAVFLTPDRPVTENEHARIQALVQRAMGGEPLSRITGTREFWGLPFQLSPATLDPRPDSETMVEELQRQCPDPQTPLKMLDLGTGSGCLLLAALHSYPNTTGLGVDKSPAAALTARRNAANLGLGNRAGFVVGDWATAITSRFDVVLSNPPYIPSGDIAGLDVAVREHDPHLALDGGTDGLEPYRILGPELRRLLSPAGLALLEIGQGQAPAVTDMLSGCGLVVTKCVPDLAGIARIIVARLPHNV